jgi:WD40 repeat protein/transcriptional regulator with XRE-family HTH domain
MRVTAGRHVESAETFRGRMLVLRGRTSLTQQQLASRLGVSTRTIQYWETGVSYPAGANLKGLVGVFLENAAFTPGQEREDAERLWEAASLQAPRLAATFDSTWFEDLLASFRASRSGVNAGFTGGARRHDWGDAPEVGELRGRATELGLLRNWVVDEHCRLVVLLGMGGIGKTVLATRLAVDVAAEFDFVYWRSLRNGRPAGDWLAGAVQHLSAHRQTPAADDGDRLDQLVELLRVQRCLLILDNLETVLESGLSAPRYRDEFGGYRDVLRRVAEVSHQGCVLVTSREKPPEVGRWEGQRAPARSLRLGGLDNQAGRALLETTGLSVDEALSDRLVRRYSGNALALKIVADTIAEIFGGDIEAFLSQTVAVFGDIRRLLDGHLERLSSLELEILYRLAIEREPVALADLLSEVSRRASHGEAIEAIEALRRRSMIERGDTAASFTLQPVILEYMTDRLVAACADEIKGGRLDLLRRFALVQAQARVWVRRSQEQLIAHPLLTRLQANHDTDAVPGRLIVLLEELRAWPTNEQGCAPGNLVNLLRLRSGHLRGVDLSRLLLRQVYLADVEAQDANLAGARLAEAVVADAYTWAMSVALSADGRYLAVGGTTGDAYVWRVADRTLITSIVGHIRLVLSVALSGDGRVLATGGLDGTVKLWDTATGQLMHSLEATDALVWNVALSRDGRVLAASRGDGRLVVWQASVDPPMTTIRPPHDISQAFAFSGDGRVLACGSTDGTLTCLAVPGGHVLTSVRAHSGYITGAALSFDGTVAASCGPDPDVKVWDTSSGAELASLQGMINGAGKVALSEDGQTLACTSRDNTVEVWQIASGLLLANLRGSARNTGYLSLSGNGELAAATYADGSVLLWHTATGRVPVAWRSRVAVDYLIRLSADGQVLATQRTEGASRIWNTSSGSLVTSCGSEPSDTALSSDGRTLATCQHDTGVSLWDTSTGQELATFAGDPGNDGWGVAVSGTGEVVASSGGDGTVKVWEVPTRRVLATMHAHEGSALRIVLSADGRVLASRGGDGLFKAWDAHTGRLLVTLDAHTEGDSDMVISADGHLVGRGRRDGTVCLWEVPSGRLTAVIEDAAGLCTCAMSADGAVLATGGMGHVRIWEVATGRLRADYEVGAEPIWSVALSGDGRLLAHTAGFEGTQLRDAESGRLLRTFCVDRPYERMDITGLSGLTDAQWRALVALGARQRTP